MSRGNPNSMPGTFDCSLYTKRIAFKVNNREKRTRLQTISWNTTTCSRSQHILTLPAGQNQFNQGDYFKTATASRTFLQ